MIVVKSGRMELILREKSENVGFLVLRTSERDLQDWKDITRASDRSSKSTVFHKEVSNV